MEEHRETDACLLCHSTAPGRVVNRIARGGVPQTSVLCGRCDLVQVEPMPSRDEVRSYYADGSYRREFPPLPVNGVPPGQPLYEDARQEQAAAEAAWLTHADRGLPLDGSHLALEVGCGEGRLAEALVARGARVHVEDVDPAMLDAARARGLSRSSAAERYDLIMAMQVLEHDVDPLALLGSWRERLTPTGMLHVQVPTLERMYGGSSYFFQRPHLVQFTERTLVLALIRAGFAPREVGISGAVLYATAAVAERPLSFEEAESIVERAYPERPNVAGLIAAHNAARPPRSSERTSTDVLLDFIRGGDVSMVEQAQLRAEVRLMLDTISMTRESISALSTQANERSRAREPREEHDPWVLGYLAGCSRESQATAGALGALQNGMDVWAACRRSTTEGGA